MTEYDQSDSSGNDIAAKKMPESVRLEDKNCPLGCTRDDEFVLSGHDLLSNLPGQFSVVKCKGCGLMRTNPRPSADTIGFYYPDDYGPYKGTQVVDVKPNSALKRFLKPMVNWIFDDKAQALPTLKPSNMLEVGCASGSFLHKMAGQGWHVEGIEFSEQAAQSAIDLGYKVHIGSLEDAPSPSQQYDLIVGWMVLEHLHDPMACLIKLNEWTSEEAYLVLSVPNANSETFSFFNDKWHDLHLPNHLYHFTPKTLNQALKAGGWDLDKIHQQRSLINPLVSAANLLESKALHGAAKMLNNLAYRGGVVFYALFPIAWIFAVFGQTGRMTVWAKKINKSGLDQQNVIVNKAEQ